MLTMSNDLRYYKLYSEVKDPIRATEGSSCFDLYSFLQEDKPVKVYLNQLEEIEKKDRSVRNGRVQVNPHERVLIPTGLIFDIPRGYSVRLYPRSGLALKQGLTLANNVGIIDWDYVEPVYAMIVNISGDVKYVNNNERICQGELFKDQLCVLQEVNERPETKTEREGGFGSTGKG
jgi:dUTP pyrophosphatase